MKQIKIVIMAFAFITMFASCTGNSKDANGSNPDSTAVAIDSGSVDSTSTKVDSASVDTTSQK